MLLPSKPEPEASPAVQPRRAAAALWLQRVLIVALGYGLAGKACLLLSGPSTELTPLWLPMGVLLAVWLRWGAGCMPGLLLGVAALLSDPAAPRDLLLALVAGDLAGAAAGVWALRRCAIDPRLERRGDIGLLVGLTLVAAHAGCRRDAGCAGTPAAMPPCRG